LFDSISILIIDALAVGAVFSIIFFIVFSASPVIIAIFLTVFGVITEDVNCCVNSAKLTPLVFTPVFLVTISLTASDVLNALSSIPILFKKFVTVFGSNPF
jgi:hypothetical protein